VNRSLNLFLFLALFGMLSVSLTRAQDEHAGPPTQQGQGRQGGQRPIFGKITAIHDSSMEVTGQDGSVITVKLTAQTEFRKDREPAKVTDFKVGDMVMVRGDQNADNSVTARMISARSGAMGPGSGGPNGRGTMMNPGTLGKDYVAGEVKAIDAPKLTILRTDGVTQTLELNEDTSLHRGRQSITMADIQVGDHIMARGAAQNDMFVPKGVMVMSPEQWQRMQEMMSQQGGAGKPAGSEQPATKPQE